MTPTPKVLRLRTIASALRAGHSLAEAIQAVSDATIALPELSEPLREYFAETTYQLGEVIVLGTRYGVSDDRLADLFEGAAEVEELLDTARAPGGPAGIDREERDRAAFAATVALLLDVGIPLALALEDAASTAPLLAARWRPDMPSHLGATDQNALTRSILALPGDLPRVIQSHLGEPSLVDALRAWARARMVSSS